jgi:hypothetical protein
MVPVQAIPLALVSSLYPLGLAAVLLLSKATRPRAKEAVFLAGAAVICLTVGFVVVLSGQGTESSQGGSSSSSYGLELAIGLFFLAAAAVLPADRPSSTTGHPGSPGPPPKAGSSRSLWPGWCSTCPRRSTCRHCM